MSEEKTVRVIAVNTDYIEFSNGDRTDTSYFHDYIYGKAEVHSLRGRLKFELGGQRRKVRHHSQA